MRAKTKRPRSVTITLLGVIFLGTWSAARAVALAEQLELLVALGTRPDPRLLLVVASLWAVLFWALAIALFLRVTAVRWLIPLLIFLHALYEFGLQALFESLASPIQIWLFRALLYVLFIIFAVWSLNRKGSEPYFAGVQPALPDDQQS